MGKVKDGAPASKASKPAEGGAGRRIEAAGLAPFLANLVRVNLYKPMQGLARPALDRRSASGSILAVGLWRLYETLLLVRARRSGSASRAPSALALGWFIFRLVQYPPFVEFLIATEAEMNKVSWTSRDDLYRATTVVLATVVLMAVFLFGVDWVWSNLLQIDRRPASSAEAARSARGRLSPRPRPESGRLRSRRGGSGSRVPLRRFHRSWPPSPHGVA